MNRDIYPLTIVSDRYNGTYSGALFLAFNIDYDVMPNEIGGSDPDEMNFFSDGGEHENYYIGKGSTVQEAFDDLYNQLNP